MNVHIRIPYSLEKNIGKKYNEEFATCPDGDALAFLDGDCMFCIPDFGHIIHEYANEYPNDVLTCWTNRTHALSVMQQSQDCKSKDVLECLKYAASIKLDMTVFNVKGVVSMLLMVIPKSVWEVNKFIEHNKYRPNEPNLLGCDSEWTNRIRNNGVRILRMNGMFIYHQYRLLSQSKEHLL